ncbi:MAG: Kelch repeat-containing protein [Candidatus Thorarchaeota archaeon]|jgi:N-acetylneuraminic acid mutarotase
MRIRNLFWFVLVFGFLAITPSASNVAFSPASSVLLAQNDSPSGRYLPGFVYDPINDRIMMFGGSNDDDLFDDTWVLNTSSGIWTELALANSPVPRHSGVMVYDTTDEVIILFGGHNGTDWGRDTWVFDCGTETWTEVTPALSPPGRGSAAMVYDSANDRVLLFSGYSEGGPYVADTWAYDHSTNTWEEMSPAESPHARYGAAYAYDVVNESMIIFGGNSNGYFSDTWRYDYPTDTWTELDPTTHPQTLKWSQMVYDSTNHKIIHFGGDGATSRPENDTWIYDSAVNSWEEREPIDAPPAREAFGFTYDPVAEKAVLFGGTLHNPDVMNDTWAYDYETNTWEELGIPSDPSTTSPDLWLIIAGAAAVGIILIVVILIIKRKTG